MCIRDRDKDVRMHVYLGEKPKEEKEKRKEDELVAVARDIFGRHELGSRIITTFTGGTQI